MGAARPTGGARPGDPGPAIDLSDAEWDARLANAGGVSITDARSLSRADRTAIIACGAVAREVLASIDVAGLTAVDLFCLPALLHNRPEQLPDQVSAAVAAARRNGYGRVAVAYADCGTGGRLAAACEAAGVEMLPGAHCYAFFDGVADFEARAEAEIGAFYLTDFLTRQFDALVWRGLGLDRDPALRDVYFARYDRVVHLAQTHDVRLDAKARAAAARLGLRYVRRFTGLGAVPEFVASAAGRGRPGPQSR